MNLGNSPKAWCPFMESGFDDSQGTSALLGEFFSTGDWPHLSLTDFAFEPNPDHVFRELFFGFHKWMHYSHEF